ncbi:FxSxx-COOH system tetratricopeptide repeat protein [Actinomadura sp. DC4]|uniref:FxSxx-COOH system tetratricopeptide repeat protein n=1 Tax=Actinomadura sp. DC4 TaxID=3055069 RepID=UPI0025B003CA|nr:FxSxx-COOH system tetratricopeptide repeat protein [Actinomadura sp. DC4]MDN3354133.1 FxSxx-COOH system tetratricopeptide repeat protein [Actinomadura sp. DC4]
MPGEAAQRFISDLIRLRREAGMPSYSTLERLSDRRLSRSTMSDILTGKRVRLPEWRFVVAFVAACRAAAVESELDPDGLGAPAAWKRRWDDAASGFTDTSYPGQGGAGLARGTDAVLRPGPGVAMVGPVPTAPAPTDFPEHPPAHRAWGPVPPRVHEFVGRREELDALRRSLATCGDNSVIAVQGLGGVGKTQLAVEYAHRYESEYDFVGWVSGATRESATAGLAAVELAATSKLRTHERASAVVEALRVGRPYARWLLVFDDADDPDQVKDLMPPGPGHIIITTRNKRWNAFEDLLELDVLTRDESVDFLRRRIRGLSAADAHGLAEAAGDLPLVLEHAAESRMPVQEYLTRLENAPRALLSENPPSGYPVPVTESWEVAIGRLREDSLDAWELLQCCSFFGPGPIPLESLERGRYLPHSSVHATLLDPIRRGRATIALGRTGLARVSSARRTIQVHCLVQSVVRDGLSEDRTRRSRHDVHLLLAAADPGDPDDFDNWPRYEELRGHIGPSKVEGCHDVAVRRFLLNMVRYLRIVGDPVAARALADQGLGQWPDSDDEDPDAVAMNLALNRSKVDALCALGLYKDALGLFRTTYERMTETLGDENEETVILGRTKATELRRSGRFLPALEADQESVATHRRVFDSDHPQTFMAINNLTIDLTLNGTYEGAVKEGEKVYRDCLTFYGRNDHPAVLVYQNAMARSMRLAGHYRAALEVAMQVHEGYRSLIRREILKADHPWVLTHANDLAVARMAAGAPNALSLAKSVYWDSRRVFGFGHPQTLAAQVTLGSVLRGAGRLSEALEMTGDAARHYATTLGPEHPYTHACSANLAAARGQGGTLAKALGLIETTVAGLQETVGDDHHYTLAAKVIYANILAEAGGTETALNATREALNGLRQLLGPDHPHTLAAEGNLSLVLAEVGDDAEATVTRAGLHPRFQQSLGERHPEVSRFVERQRLDIEFFPVPI